MERLFGICDLALVPLRAQSSDRSEMVSQLLFGDTFEIIQQVEKWIFIRTAYDNYEGWIDYLQHKLISQTDFDSLQGNPYLIDLSNNSAAIKPNKEAVYLVPGSSIPFYEEGWFHINDISYTIANVVDASYSRNFKSGIESAARFYLNAPYLWGGKSPYGIDCSGFTQIVFKQFHIPILRDASEQALQGEQVSSLNEAQSGDLAFFNNAEGRVTHVGILLSKNQIIHASGFVKINSIDNEGIYNADLGKYTHQLSSISRFI
jgi:hypothetical protein